MAVAVLASTTEYLPPLRFETAMVLESGTQQQVVHGSVHGLPARLSVAADPQQAVVQFLSGYPSLTGSRESHLADGIILNDRHTGAGWVMRTWSSPSNPTDPAEYAAFVENFEDRCTLLYRGHDDRWVFPALGGDTAALHPLLAWWALLYALSMLARYEPASWVNHLNVDASPSSVPLESALGHALNICPHLILQAIRAVSS